MVQDYHLLLVPGILAEHGLQDQVIHFTHTPFPTPTELQVFDPEIRSEILQSLSQVRCGFHTEAWAKQFSRVAAKLKGLIWILNRLWLIWALTKLL